LARFGRCPTVLKGLTCYPRLSDTDLSFGVPPAGGGGSHAATRVSLPVQSFRNGATAKYATSVVMAVLTWMATVGAAAGPDSAAMRAFVVLVPMASAPHIRDKTHKRRKLRYQEERAAERRIQASRLLAGIQQASAAEVKDHQVKDKQAASPDKTSTATATAPPKTHATHWTLRLSPWSLARAQRAGSIPPPTVSAVASSVSSSSSSSSSFSAAGPISNSISSSISRSSNNNDDDDEHGAVQRFLRHMGVANLCRLLHLPHDLATDHLPSFDQLSDDLPVAWDREWCLHALQLAAAQVARQVAALFLDDPQLASATATTKGAART
jgi:hypothetical protein